MVYGMQLPGKGIIAAQHDLTGADLGRQMADRPTRRAARLSTNFESAYSASHQTVSPNCGALHESGAGPLRRSPRREVMSETKG